MISCFLRISSFLATNGVSCLRPAMPYLMIASAPFFCLLRYYYYFISLYFYCYVHFSFICVFMLMFSCCCRLSPSPCDPNSKYCFFVHS